MNFPKATTVERIMMYVEDGELDKARALAKLCDFLEESFRWEVVWDQRRK
tara:strand:+ start:4578 stop:4727 length:150 start_codon:yes stop_codon:yes gene_type:complete